MALGKSAGVFDLKLSDKCVGSFFKRSDLATILGVNPDLPGNVEFKVKDGLDVIADKELGDLWKKKKLPGSERKFRRRVSFDEIVLRALVLQTYPDAVVEQQHQVGTNHVDLKVTIFDPRVRADDRVKLIEFDGPGHFTKKSFDWDRKKLIQDKAKLELVTWPYWIQRCANNVKAVFGQAHFGLGALWSSKEHFGEFVDPDSAGLIQTLSERFGAWSDTGSCDWYEKDSKGRIKPEHPVLKKILLGKAVKTKLLPKGFTTEEHWLPKIIR